jgi:hypothetical protein
VAACEEDKRTAHHDQKHHRSLYAYAARIVRVDAREAVTVASQCFWSTSGPLTLQLVQATALEPRASTSGCTFPDLLI